MLLCIEKKVVRERFGVVFVGLFFSYKKSFRPPLTDPPLVSMKLGTRVSLDVGEEQVRFVSTQRSTLVLSLTRYYVVLSRRQRT